MHSTSNHEAEDRVRRPRRIPLLSAKKWMLRLQWAQTDQNWTVEDRKNGAGSDESQFLLRHTDGRVGIWCQQHESKDPICLVSTVQAGRGGVMVGESFLGKLYNQSIIPWMPQLIADCNVHCSIFPVCRNRSGMITLINAVGTSLSAVGQDLTRSVTNRIPWQSRHYFLNNFQ